MEHHKLVLPEHINQYGFLFGGYLLQWIDEFAYITATIQYPSHHFVTVAMDNVAFHKGITKGEVLRFVVERDHQGNTSVRYLVKAYGTMQVEDPNEVLFQTNITFVSVDGHGHKTAIRNEP